MRRWSQGLSQWWLKDVGCNSFLQAALVGWLTGALFLLLGKPQMLGLMFSLALVSVWSAGALQLVRLRAQENLLLIPGASSHYLVQLAFVLTLVTLLTLVLIAACYPPALNPVLLACSLSAAFMLLTLRAPNFFYLSFFTYLALIFVDNLVILLPLWLPGTLFVLLVLTLCHKLSRADTLRWHPNAKNITVSGVETGWMWLPGVSDNSLADRLSRLLFPISFYTGPMLAGFLFMLTAGTLLAGLLLPAFEIHFPVGFILLQGAGIACLLVHWSRILRRQSTESLLVLPVFDGRRGLAQAMWQSQLRLLILLALLSLLIMTLLNPLSGLDWQWLVQLVLLQLAGCAWCLAAGSLCQRSAHLPWLMLCLIGYSTLAGILIKMTSTSGLAELWWLWHFAAVALGLMALRWACNRGVTGIGRLIG
ncbi:hypothetical protein [Shewanella sp. GXUN23E]|uniref:hypothetical protein n=1 Tax=Shewanella sp. GXUN23E TaxID=3422498 RepID=UPI003D7D17B9